MKFWLKIFWPVFILFTCAFYAGIFLTAQFSYKNSLNTSREQAFAQHKFIAASLSKDLDAISGRTEGEERQKAVLSLVEYYVETYENQTTSIQLFQGGKSLNDIPQNLPMSDTLKTPSDSRRSVVLGDGDRQYIAVTGTVQNDYVLIYAYDITQLVGAQKRLIKALLLSCIIIELITTVLLYFLIKYLTKPIKTLQDATSRIAAGEYGVRAEVRGNDEIAALASQFNGMAAEVSARIEEQTQLSLARQQFIDNLAHELKTPLTAIYSNAELLQTTKFSDDDLIDATSQIMRQTNRIQDMSKKLLDIALNRKLKIEKKPVDLKSLFQKIKEEMSPTFNQKGLDLILCCDADFIFGDASLIENLLVNLLDNAVKASKTKGTIYLSSRRRKDSVVIELRDQGIGIRKEQLNSIFEPFYRTDFARAKSSERGGAGLGLALCKQIADLHGAEIKVQSVPGKGTTFTLIFTTPQQLNENSMTA